MATVGSYLIEAGNSVSPAGHSASAIPQAMPTRDPIIRGDTGNRRATVNDAHTVAMIAIVS